MDSVQRRVYLTVYGAVARAYGHRPVTDEGYDEQLCACQRLRPEPGSDLCRRCEEEACH